MNPLNEFLITTHYYSLVDKIAFVSILASACIIRNWNRELLIVFLIISGFYFVELLASAVNYFVPPEIGNAWFYNIVQVPELGITLWYFVHRLDSQKRRFAYRVIFLAFFVMHLIITIFVIGWSNLDVYALVPMTTITAVAALEYLYELLDNVQLNPTGQIAFWFAFATVFSNFSSVPITSLYLKISTYDAVLANRIWNINDVVYGIWFIITAFGLIWISRKRIPSY